MFKKISIVLENGLILKGFESTTAAENYARTIRLQEEKAYEHDTSHKPGRVYVESVIVEMAK